MYPPSTNYLATCKDFFVLTLFRDVAAFLSKLAQSVPQKVPQKRLKISTTCQKRRFCGAFPERISSVSSDIGAHAV